MIKLIENAAELDSFNKDDIYFIRIMSLLKAYAVEYSFASFYKQIDENGEITAIISRLDSDYTLCAGESADVTEISNFFKVVGFNSVLCSNDIEMPFDYTCGAVMKTQKKAEFVLPYTDIDEYPKLMDLFNFDDYSSTDFENWYVDVSHRIRRGCAKAVTLCVNGEVVSSAILSSIYNDEAVLSAVRTQSEFRKMGYASALVSAIIGDVKGSVYLMRDEGKNERFYSRLGFINVGLWRIYK